MSNKLLDGALICYPQHCLHLRERDFLTGIRDSLIEDAQSIAHTTSSRSGNQFRRASLQLDLLLLRDKVQMVHNLTRRKTLEIERLATRDYGWQHLMHISGCHDKNSMGWRLFQRFE